jgi:alanine racemase
LNNWIEISEANLAHNFHTLQTAAGDATEVLAVVKANAYGHGVETCSAMLARAGAKWLGVTCASEGARVRAALGDPTIQILIMSGFLPDDVPLILLHGLTPVLWTAEQVAWLTGNPGLRVHVEVDTGMGRQGVNPGRELTALLNQLAQADLVADGIFTHFCSSEQAHSALTRHQERLFEAAIAQAEEAGVNPTWVHAGNSSTLDNPAQTSPWLADLAASINARAMVRTGLALYGYCLPIDGEASPHVQPDLRPVMTWKAHVLAVRSLAAGETVGYNATFTAQLPMRVALLPVGYADGLRRELSYPHGWVMLHGRRAQILGRVSMNLTVVDVTAIEAVATGDEATILGEGITADQHAKLAHTIAYEIVCGVHPCA